MAFLSFVMDATTRGEQQRDQAADRPDAVERVTEACGE
jgi:hypothetical protein